MVRTAAVIVALVVVSSGSAASVRLVPTIVPGVGEGGVTLGMTRAQYDRTVGTLPSNAINWWNVEFAGDRLVSVQTFANWKIAGTGFINQRDQNLAALKRAYGPHLRGPYQEGGDFLDSPTVFYELMGTLHGRRVHTLFDLDTDEPDRQMIVDTTVSFCDGPAQTDIGCGRHKSASS